LMDAICAGNVVLRRYRKARALERCRFDLFTANRAYFSWLRVLVKNCSFTKT
jgi:hypothetical protein